MRSALVLFILAALSVTAHAKIKTQLVEYKQGADVLEGYLSYDDAVKGKRPGVFVVHAWMGLDDNARKRADMLAGLGYVAFAADIYGKGIRPKIARRSQQARGQVQEPIASCSAIASTPGSRSC